VRRRRPAEGRDPFDDDRLRPRARDARPHRDEERREVGDLRLAGGVLDRRRPARERGGEEDVLGPGHGDLREADGRPGEPSAPRADAGDVRVDVPLLDGDAGPHRLERGDVEVDGADADGAAAREGDAGLAERARSGPRTRIEARIVRTRSYGASVETMREASSVTVPGASPEIATPIPARSLFIVRMSATGGRRSRATGRSARSAAATAGRAAFFAPETASVPERRQGPETRKASKAAGV
jgi:hypothetical protein